MKNNDKKFIDGMWYKENDKGPDFVKANILVDVKQFVKSAKKYIDDEGKLKLEVKVSKKGNHYIEVDDFEPDNSKGTKIDDDEIPVVDEEDDIDVDAIDFS